MSQWIGNKEVGLSKGQTSGYVGGKYVRRPEGYSTSDSFIVDTPEQAAQKAKILKSETATHTSGKEYGRQIRYMQAIGRPVSGRDTIQVKPDMTPAQIHAYEDMPRASGAAVRARQNYYPSFTPYAPGISAGQGHKYPSTPIEKETPAGYGYATYPLYKEASKLSNWMQGGIEKRIDLAPGHKNVKQIASGFSGFFTGLPEWGASGLVGWEAVTKTRDKKELPRMFAGGVGLMASSISTQAKKEPYKTAGFALGMLVTPRIMKVPNLNMKGTSIKMFGSKRTSINPNYKKSGFDLKTELIQSIKTPKSAYSKMFGKRTNTNPNYIKPKVSMVALKEPTITELSPPSNIKPLPSIFGTAKGVIKPTLGSQSSVIKRPPIQFGTAKGVNELTIGSQFSLIKKPPGRMGEAKGVFEPTLNPPSSPIKRPPVQFGTAKGVFEPTIGSQFSLIKKPPVQLGTSKGIIKPTVSEFTYKGMKELKVPGRIGEAKTIKIFDSSKAKLKVKTELIRSIKTPKSSYSKMFGKRNYIKPVKKTRNVNVGDYLLIMPKTIQTLKPKPSVVIIEERVSPRLGLEKMRLKGLVKEKIQSVSASGGLSGRGKMISLSSMLGAHHIKSSAQNILKTQTATKNIFRTLGASGMRQTPKIAQIVHPTTTQVSRQKYAPLQESRQQYKQRQTTKEPTYFKFKNRDFTPKVPKKPKIPESSTRKLSGRNSIFKSKYGKFKEISPVASASRVLTGSKTSGMFNRKSKLKRKGRHIKL